MIKQKLVVLFILFILSVAYLLRWHHWTTGTVMTKSQQPNTSNPSHIIVRELPSSAPFWAALPMLLLDDSPMYRCELYEYGSEEIVSAQSYDAPSFHTAKATVRWEQPRTATVYLGDVPVLKFDETGQWKGLK